MKLIDTNSWRLDAWPFWLLQRQRVNKMGKGEGCEDFCLLTRCCLWEGSGSDEEADFETLNITLSLFTPPQLLTQLLNFAFLAPEPDSDTCWPPRSQGVGF